MISVFISSVTASYLEIVVWSFKSTAEEGGTYGDVQETGPIACWAYRRSLNITFSLLCLNDPHQCFWGPVFQRSSVCVSSAGIFLFVSPKGVYPSSAVCALCAVSRRTHVVLRDLPDLSSLAPGKMKKRPSSQIIVVNQSSQCVLTLGLCRWLHGCQCQVRTDDEQSQHVKTCNFYMLVEMTAKLESWVAQVVSFW